MGCNDSGRAQQFCTSHVTGLVTTQKRQCIVNIPSMRCPAIPSSRHRQYGHRNWGGRHATRSQFAFVCDNPLSGGCFWHSEELLRPIAIAWRAYHQTDSEVGDVGSDHCCQQYGVVGLSPAIALLRVCRLRFCRLRFPEAPCILLHRSRCQRPGNN